MCWSHIKHQLGLKLAEYPPSQLRYITQNQDVFEDEVKRVVAQYRADTFGNNTANHNKLVMRKVLAGLRV